MKALFATLLWWLAGAALADDAVLRVEASEPRAYGYQVGDHVQRRDHQRPELRARRVERRHLSVSALTAA